MQDTPLEDIRGTKPTAVIDDENEIERIVQMNNLTFDYSTSTLDMAKQKCMDMATNRRVVMPQPRSPKEEAILETRRDMWIKEALKYME